MLIHANTKEQCHGDADPKCLDDYSLCVLKPGEWEREIFHRSIDWFFWRGKPKAHRAVLVLVINVDS